jgi:undecaprenyl diphosphate synthase
VGERELLWTPVASVRRWLAERLAKRLWRLPVHVAIIPDGNRRWARRRGLPAWMGHVYGYLRMRSNLDLLWRLGVRYVTVYALSRENCLRRPRDELTRLFALLRKAVEDVSRDPRVRSGQLSVRVVGDRSLLPPSLRRDIERLEAASQRGSRVLAVALCYSGRWEIAEAARRLARSGAVDVDERVLSRYMVLGLPEPDLVIRTGGEMRLSNFLLWHVAYSELYFSRKLWPDFDELDLVRALLDYQRRERRFGR